MMNINEINELFVERLIPKYSRSNYDKYVNDTHFNFNVPSIHITGTNGKGSVANFLNNIYIEKGLKVGLFISPWLNKVNEMISINNNQITDQEIESLFNELFPLFNQYQLTSFEMQTIMAYTYFVRNNVDLAIIEVGIGGYIDATNIINPLLSIITSVSLEHTSYLGRSVSEIAASKAGIIKYEKPCLVGILDETAMYSIRLTAKENKSKIYQTNMVNNIRVGNEGVLFDYYPYSNIKINTHASYETKNAAIAIEATNILKEYFDIDFDTLQRGLLKKCLPCRYEYINEHIILDGGHNPEAIENLVSTVQSDNIDKPIHVIFATLKDKNIAPMLIQLGLISNDVTLTTFNHKRVRDEMDYFLYLGDYVFEEDYQKLIEEKLTQYPDDLLLITGSLYFTGIVRQYLLEKNRWLS